MKRPVQPLSEEDQDVLRNLGPALYSTFRRCVVLHKLGQPYKITHVFPLGATVCEMREVLELIGVRLHCIEDNDRVQVAAYLRETIDKYQDDIMNRVLHLLAHIGIPEN